MAIIVAAGFGAYYFGSAFWFLTLWLFLYFLVVYWGLNSRSTTTQTSLTSSITKIQLQMASDWHIELKVLILLIPQSSVEAYGRD